MRRTIYTTVLYEPTSEPVTLVDAKTHLRVDNSLEDSLIANLVRAAREIVERKLNSSLVTQTRVARLDSFPACRDIIIPYGPVIAISGTDTATVPNTLGVTYYNESEVLTTLDGSLFHTDFSSSIPRIEVKNYWPATFDRPNAVLITYTAGYGAAASVPSSIKSAMLLILGHLYENRENVVEGSMIELPYGAEALLAPFVKEHTVVYDGYRTPR